MWLEWHGVHLKDLGASNLSLTPQAVRCWVVVPGQEEISTAWFLGSDFMTEQDACGIFDIPVRGG